MKNSLTFPMIMMCIMGICGISTMTPYGIYGGVLIILLGLYAWSKGFEYEDRN